MTARNASAPATDADTSFPCTPTMYTSDTTARLVQDPVRQAVRSDGEYEERSHGPSLPETPFDARGVLRSDLDGHYGRTITEKSAQNFRELRQGAMWMAEALANEFYANQAP